ncbi:TonB-dependent receptor plug domain-containing protein [Salisaeta longa]|uniref:TonB-dependent receptor plug domain-containing protein n=1 Tax=Salisaeta longa TaxID=503170 RepID=UPI0003B464D7|nr:TonB-dependent receptor [Salisaeta longa]
MRSVLGFCLLMLAAAPLAAQPADSVDVAMTVQLSDSVVVTATRYATPAQTTGRRVLVWDARAIDRLPVTSVDQLLNVVAGVDVQSRGGFGVQGDLTIRGSTFNGVLVLLDGMRLNDPMSGHFAMDLPVPLASIARVEVLRGPAAALYGPDAIGGVVHLITHAGLRGTALSSGGTLAGRYGAHQLYATEGSARYGGAATAVTAAAALQGTDGEAIAGTNGAVHTRFDRRTATAALAQALGDWSLYARAGVDDRDFSAYHYYTAFASDTAREATGTQWGQVRARFAPTARTQWTTQVAAKRHTDAYWYNPQVPAPNRHTSRRLVGKSYVQHRLSPGLVATGGVQASLRAIDSNNLGAHSDHRVGGFTHLRWQPVSGVTLNGSARLDYDAVFGWAVVPQLFGAYTRGAWTLRGGVGRAVRAPNYVERFYNTALPEPPDASLGNPNLNAETAWNYEAGLDWRAHPLLTLHTTAFVRTTNNLIDYARRPGDRYFVARNIYAVTTRGLEAEATLRQQWAPGRRARLQVGYTLLDATLDGADPALQYTYAQYQARHLLQTAGQLQWGRASVGASGLWKERMQTPDGATRSFTVWNVRAGYRLPWAAQPTLTLQVRNLFDTAYSEVFDAPMPGRWWTVGVRMVL